MSVLIDPFEEFTIIYFTKKCILPIHITKVLPSTNRRERGRVLTINILSFVCPKPARVLIKSTSLGEKKF